MQKYIVLILTMFFFGCVNKQEKNARFTEKQITSLQLDATKILKVEIDTVTKVDLNPFLKQQSFDFGSLVKEVKLIPLETTVESLLDRIRKVVVADSNIYIYDDFKGGGVVIFDKEGKFIKRIPNGKGPGELIRLYDIDFDKDNNELIAYQHSFLLYFTPSGQFIRQKKLPFVFHKFSVIPEGYVFKTIDRQGNEHLQNLQDFTLLITDKNFKLRSVALPCLPSDVNLEGRNYLYNSNNTLHVTQKYADTIYQYIGSSDKLKAKYILDYSNKKLPEHYLQGTWKEFENAIRKNDYYFYLGEYLDTETHHVFFLNNWYKNLQAVLYRDKKSGNLRGGTNADYNLNEIPPIGFPQAVSDNYFISLYFPNKNDSFFPKSSIISDKDKLKIKGLTENDNPVLVFYKLKNF